MTDRYIVLLNLGYSGRLEGTGIHSVAFKVLGETPKGFQFEKPEGYRGLQFYDRTGLRQTSKRSGGGFHPRRTDYKYYADKDVAVLCFAPTAELPAGVVERFTALKEAKERAALKASAARSKAEDATSEKTKAENARHAAALDAIRDERAQLCERETVAADQALTEFRDYLRSMAGKTAE